MISSIFLLLSTAASVAHLSLPDRLRACDAAAASGLMPPIGCADALNLRAMLADPRDLQTPGEAPPGLGDSMLRAVERHRRDDVRPVPSSSTGGDQQPPPP